LRRLFLLVAAVVLVDTMFFSALTPLLPSYRDTLGLTKSAAGVLSAAYAAGTLSASLPGGWLAARVGVKPTLLAGLGLLAWSSLAFAFADSYPVLVTARFVQGIGGAFSWSGGLAWLLKAAPADQRGRWVGSALAAAIAGSLLGPVLGGLATAFGARPVFGGVAFIAGLLATWALLTPAPPPPERPSWRTLVRALATPAVLLAVWLVMLPALFSGTVSVLAPLRLDELGAGGLAIGAVFLMAAAVDAALARVFGALSDRHGRMALIRLGLAAAVPFALLLPLAATVTVEGLLVIGAVAALAGFWAPGIAQLADTAEASGLDQGFAMALTNLAWASGQVGGGALGGRLADLTTDAVPYLVLAGLCAVTLVAARARGSARILTFERAQPLYADSSALKGQEGGQRSAPTRPGPSPRRLRDIPDGDAARDGR
jgi:MFS family permease